MIQFNITAGSTGLDLKKIYHVEARSISECTLENVINKVCDLIRSNGYCTLNDLVEQATSASDDVDVFFYPELHKADYSLFGWESKDDIRCITQATNSDNPFEKPAYIAKFPIAEQILHSLPKECNNNTSKRSGRYPWGTDMVNHPPHYMSETGLETYDVIEAFTFDLQGIEAVNTGNVLKYMCRWKKKNGLQDLKKAQWYLTHLIDHVEKLQKENEPLCQK